MVEEIEEPADLPGCDQVITSIAIHIGGINEISEKPEMMSLDLLSSIKKKMPQQRRTFLLQGY
jgi:hypothetical protein